MKVINLFGGPSCGKSTTAAGLFHILKVAGFNVELVTEYAKDMVWEGRGNILEDQLYILAKQNRKLLRLKDSVEYAITDSPLLFGLIYAQPNYYHSYRSLLWDVWNSYENLNVRLMRPPKETYSGIGRVQGTYEEAIKVDDTIQRMLDANQVPYNSFAICEGLPWVLSEFLIPELGEVAALIRRMKVA